VKNTFLDKLLNRIDRVAQNNSNRRRVPVPVSQLLEAGGVLFAPLLHGGLAGNESVGLVLVHGAISSRMNWSRKVRYLSPFLARS